MNLNEYHNFSDIDKQDMLSEINNLPDQLAHAWKIGLEKPIQIDKNIDRVLLAGMGGSAIGADLLAAYLEPICPIPVYVYRDYGLPAWAHGPTTLVIASSHSGNTEETLSVLESAVKNQCQTMTISTGGRLFEIASSNNILAWSFDHQGQPRSAVGYSFGLLLAVFTRLGLIPDPSRELQTTVDEMDLQKASLLAEVPVSNNPAKRLAGQAYGRWIVVMASGLLSPVARRWKCQINEIAKAWAQFEFIPEADHNTLAGIENPESALSNTFVYFLASPSDHPRNQDRIKLTQRTFMLQGIGTDTILVPGETRLANQWCCLHLGDYISYYLAMLYRVDPTPVEIIQSFKSELMGM